MGSPTLAPRMENGECELIMNRLMTCSRHLCLLTRVDHLKTGTLYADMGTCINTDNFTLLSVFVKKICDVTFDGHSQIWCLVTI
jgi:hypothetical protein